MPSFDVLFDPWVPVVDLYGVAREVGVREALVKAHEIRDIRDPIPTVEFGIYRLLTAFVLDIFRPADTRSLGELLDKKRFAAEQIDAYLEREDCRDRFDLLNATHPFLQTPGMESEKAKPLAGLLAAVPSGTNALHFHHAAENAFAVCPAAAARLLTTIAPFMTAGGAGLAPSINGAPPWYALIEGSSLFETLLLNCCAVHLTYATDLGTPVWRDNATVVNERRQNASLLESLTWQPRRIQLVATEGGGRCCLTDRETSTLVGSMKFAAGWGSGFPWTDPSVAYRITDKGALPLRPVEGKEVWRDTGPFTLLTEKTYLSERGGIRFQRPVLVDQFAQMVGDGRLPRRQCLSVRVYGMRTDMKMKVFEWQRAELALPTEMVWRSPFRREAQVAIDQAGDVDYRLRQAIKYVYPREGKGNNSAFDTVFADASRQFWSELRPAYNDLLDSLTQATEASALTAQRTWRDAVRRAGYGALDSAIGDIDTDADALFRQTQARRLFHDGMRFALLTQQEKEELRVRGRDRKAAREGGRQ